MTEEMFEYSYDARCQDDRSKTTLAEKHTITCMDTAFYIKYHQGIARQLFSRVMPCFSKTRYHYIMNVSRARKVH
jgi:hypothetical protein